MAIGQAIRPMDAVPSVVPVGAERKAEGERDDQGEYESHRFSCKLVPRLIVPRLAVTSRTLAMRG